MVIFIYICQHNIRTYCTAIFYCYWPAIEIAAILFKDIYCSIVITNYYFLFLIIVYISDCERRRKLRCPLYVFWPTIV